MWVRCLISLAYRIRPATLSLDLPASELVGSYVLDSLFLGPSGRLSACSTSRVRSLELG